MSTAASASEVARAATSRLVIDRMVLENFKSYAGKISLGPFNSVSLPTHLSICI